MSKRQRADVDGMISAGISVGGRDTTYFTTNVSNVSLYDSTFKHGIQAAFNQDRTIQIIPNTSRSEVGIAYAEIQTKSLPIFQPQVKIGQDPDTLIYEVGLTCSWSGSLIDPIAKGSRMSTLLDSDSATDIYENGTGAPTIQIPSVTINGNSFSPLIKIKDAYNNSFDLELGYRESETLLSFIFGLWRDSSSSPLYINSPLLPVLVGSVYQPMKVMAPLLNSTPSVIGAYIAVESVEGFKVGDRVRVFGGVNSAAVGTALNKYTTVLAICLYSDLIVSGGAISPTSNNPTIITSPVLVVDNTSLTGLNITSTSALYRGGYVINCEADERGGTIQFLTDEFEFKPLTITPTSSSPNVLNVNFVTAVTAGLGFLRTDGVNRYKGVVEIRSANDPRISGYYKVATVTSTTSMTLTPLTLSLDTTSAFAGNATLSLAPNAYTFNTAVSKTTPTTTEEKRMITFARYLGLQPTHSFEPLQASYPPIATVLTQSWRRAYSVDFVISAYRNLKWVTQDIAPKASVPLIQQDFGDGSTSTYYNVYDMKRFVSQCVNPALQQCLNDEDTSSSYIPNYSIQKQLDLYVTAYQRAFTQPNIDLAYQSAITYNLGDTVIYDGGIYIALKISKGALPNQAAFWTYLGPKKLQDGEDLLPLYELAWQAVTGGQAFTMVEVGGTMNPERVQLSNTPKLRTKAPQFMYDTWANLFSLHVDSYSFGDTYPYGYITQADGSFVKNDLNFNYKSWGVKNAGDGGGEEYFNIESDSSFKFLFDNFSCEAISYVNPATNDLLVYWVWSSYDNEHWTDSLKLSLYRIFVQSAESTSACVSPVQTIVVVSRTIPVVNSLASPAAYVSDFNAQIVNLTGVTGDSDSIIGEFSIAPGMLNSSKSVIRYQPDEVTFYSLQSTKVFKQLDYFVCYRHRITQKLVPLILSNYGNVNIKFVFKPT